MKAESYELAIHALELLRRQNADIGGLSSRSADELQELIEYWAEFFEEGLS